MRSSVPKALHRLAGRALLVWAEEACRLATGRAPVVVIGPEMEAARDLLPSDVRFVVQGDRLGTGHALRQAETVLRGNGEALLVTTADMPLLTAQTLRAVIERQREHNGPMTLLSVVSGTARGFGRVLRGPGGQIQGVVEERDASPTELETAELNTSVYTYRSPWLWEHLQRLAPSASGELYLTDLVAMAAAEGLTIASVEAHGRRRSHWDQHS
jgi:bifunctional UDP-N-acetylglucosamine pyrophosphorylase/glucosamine-1-phosphate N-acetyltransferase